MPAEPAAELSAKEEDSNSNGLNIICFILYYFFTYSGAVSFAALVLDE